MAGVREHVKDGKGNYLKACAQAVQVVCKSERVARYVQNLIEFGHKITSVRIKAYARWIHHHHIILSKRSCADVGAGSPLDRCILDLVHAEVLLGSFGQLSIDLHCCHFTKVRCHCHSIVATSTVEFQQRWAFPATHRLPGFFGLLAKPVQAVYLARWIRIRKLSLWLFVDQLSAILQLQRLLHEVPRQDEAPPFPAPHHVDDGS
mmetsp:Transcript_338/g.654  ORF Transcript_338/g.654 Transcript_338/m.654 type:complete len:205 (+) Transcript_338:305-919(+)